MLYFPTIALIDYHNGPYPQFLNKDTIIFLKKKFEEEEKIHKFIYPIFLTTWELDVTRKIRMKP